MRRLLSASALLAALGGCADLSSVSLAGQKPPASSAAQADCKADISAEENTRLSLIRKLLEDGKPYAALAHLDGSLPHPMVRYLRAEGLRKTGQIAAARIEYTALQGGCFDGFGQHGLGLLAAEDGKLADALTHLHAARERRPTDARIRNDYGYALMLDRNYPAARVEFMTALELDPGNALATANLSSLSARASQSAPPAAAMRLPDPPAPAEARLPVPPALAEVRLPDPVASAEAPAPDSTAHAEAMVLLPAATLGPASVNGNQP